MSAHDQLDTYAAIHFLGRAAMPDGVAYTYAERMRRTWDDQIVRIVQVLREDPNQRRAIVSTWDNGACDDTALLQFGRPSDAGAANPPCLTHLWFRRDTDGSLFTHATFRSHDLLRAGVPNAWGLCRLAEHVAEELGWPVGRLAIVSLSGHVYSDGWEAARELAQARGRGAVYEDDSERAILRVRRGVEREEWAAHERRAERAEWSAEHSDRCAHCGLLVVLWGGSGDDGCYYDHSVIAVDLLSREGAVLDTIQGRTAEGVEREVLERGWVSTLSHAAWLGREIVRARL